MSSAKMIALKLCLLTVIQATAQTQRQDIDSAALFLLQRTTATILQMTACSFRITTSYDMANGQAGLVKHSTLDDVFMKFPGKLLVISSGDKGRRGLWCDDSILSYYSYDHNNYATISAPGSIIAAIDTVSKTFGIDFPGVDFFYPDFAAAIAASAQSLLYLGQTPVNGESCVHIAGRDQEKSYEFWLSMEQWFLPVKISIHYYHTQGGPQYEASYSNWHVNPNLSNALFDFVIPPRAGKIRLLPSSGEPGEQPDQNTRP
ncbi:DUF2092 domain-containing protein [Deminuibacter soli]|uniref:DUF2092 domain-containing protein n=1 Tax=Deminuibacter soli TaxID=2291815 RepID=A0A3E1NHH6_9BACT|nr:DUF2092 domain-containing protein [Deminuibacter soli]RFM27304.1 DUF2092 domain-containing protein [Deminuibacter soli]